VLPLIGVLVIGATLAVHVEEVGDVPDGFGAVITQELVRAAESRAHVRAVVDEDRGSCLAGQACTAAIQSRTSAVAVLLVRLIGGPQRVRVVVDHLPGPSIAPRHAESDLARAGGDVVGVVAGLIAATFDEARPELSPPLAGPAEERGPPWLALSLVGAGAASAAAGVAFGLSSRGALDALDGGAAPEDEIVRLSDRASAHGTVANVLFVVAAAGIAAGIAAWVGE
jgi:hypothetical protein